MEFESRKQAQKSAWTAGAALDSRAALRGRQQSRPRGALLLRDVQPAERRRGGCRTRARGDREPAVHVCRAGHPLRLERSLVLSRHRAGRPVPGLPERHPVADPEHHGPSYKYSEENQRAQPYFHRARASELVALFDSRFPNSAARPALHAKRINAYTIHGDNQAVIQAGLRFRSQFPNAPERTEVADTDGRRLCPHGAERAGVRAVQRTAAGACEACRRRAAGRTCRYRSIAAG